MSPETRMCSTPRGPRGRRRTSTRRQRRSPFERRSARGSSSRTSSTRPARWRRGSMAARRARLGRAGQAVAGGSSPTKGGRASPGPAEYGGRGGTPTEAAIFAEEATRAGVFGNAFAVGVSMAGPTIIAHGTDAQKKRYLRPTLRGEEVWCQLFSEPGAGSDLAGLSTRAERDGDEWVVNGQKVWTSGAHFSDLGILLARTDPTAPKHRGITYLLVDMHAAGIEVRPLRQMTGCHRVQRGVPDRRAGPGREHARRRQRRLGGGDDDAGQRAHVHGRRRRPLAGVPRPHRPGPGAGRRPRPGRPAGSGGLVHPRRDQPLPGDARADADEPRACRPARRPP